MSSTAFKERQGGGHARGSSNTPATKVLTRGFTSTSSTPASNEVKGATRQNEKMGAYSRGNHAVNATRGPPVRQQGPPSGARAMASARRTVGPPTTNGNGTKKGVSAAASTTSSNHSRHVTTPMLQFQGGEKETPSGMEHTQVANHKSELPQNGNNMSSHSQNLPIESRPPLSTGNCYTDTSQVSLSQHNVPGRADHPRRFYPDYSETAWSSPARPPASASSKQHVSSSPPPLQQEKQQLPSGTERTLDELPSHQAASKTAHGSPVPESAKVPGTGFSNFDTNKRQPLMMGPRRRNQPSKGVQGYSQPKAMSENSNVTDPQYKQGASSDQSRQHPLQELLPSRSKEDSSNRINPEKVPRPNRNTAIEPVEFHTLGGSTELPPAAFSHHIAKDKGSANPRFMRCTLAKYPKSKELLRDTELPLSVSVRPLGRPRVSAGESDIGVVDFRSNGGPIRCTTCSAYVNAFVSWGQFSKVWTCNFCGGANETPEWYQSTTDSYGRRHDHEARPELNRGSWELLAPDSYKGRNGVENPITVFCVEATAQSVQSGAFRASLDAIKSAISNAAPFSRTRVALIAFDGSLHFFSLPRHQEEVRHLQVVDIDDPYCPLPLYSWALSLETNRQTLLDGVDTIASLFKDTTSVQSASISALAAATNGLEGIGGHVFIFQSSKVTCGLGQIPNREFATQYGTEKELSLLNMSPGNGEEYYTSLATTANEQQVRVDFRLLTNQHVDAAYMTSIAESTSGSIVRYDRFLASATMALNEISQKGHVNGSIKEHDCLQALPRHPDEEVHNQVRNELLADISREMGYEGAFKLRCSRGVRVKQYHGNFMGKMSPIVDVPVLDDNQQITVELEHDGTELDEGDFVYLQAAFLYTSCFGERKVRVHTLSISVTGEAHVLFKHADVEAVLALLTHRAVRQLESSKNNSTVLEDVKKTVSTECVRYLTAYRRKCALKASSGQLVLPESLKHLPLLVNCLLKTDAFLPNDSTVIRKHFSQSRKGGDPFSAVMVRSDARIVSLHRLKSLPLHLLIPYCYPRMFDIAALEGQQGYIFENIPDRYKTSLLMDGYNKVGTGAAMPHYEDGHQAVGFEYVSLPSSTWASVSQMSLQGIHLLECEKGFFLYISKTCPPEKFRELFGNTYGGPAELPSYLFSLTPQQTDLSIRLFNILGEIRREREPYLPLHVVSDQSSFLSRFASLMREDQIEKTRPSYCEYLCDLHNQVTAKMQND